MEANSPMRILGIQVENVLKLKAVAIKPDPGEAVTTITGENAAGKSAILNSIQFALGGKRMMVDSNGDKITDPVRRGQKQGRIFLDIGHLTTELTVECVITAGSDDYKLIVRGKDGRAKSAPQQLLSTLYTAIAFDPESFIRMKSADQVDTLRKLAGLDFTGLDNRRRVLYDSRELKGRELRNAQGKLATVPFHADAPEGEVDFKAASERLGKIREQRQANSATRAAVNSAQIHVQTLKARMDSLRVEINQLQARLDQMRSEYGKNESALSAAQADLATATEQASRLTEDNETEVLAEISNAQAINDKVRANKLHREQNTAVQTLQFDYDKLTSQIEAIDQEKREAIEWAEFPMAGLSFNDNQVLFEGVPLNQRSQAEQSRISVSIAAALNPKLPVVLIRNGSLYDKKSLAAIKDEAAKRGLQIWMEIVESDDPSAIEIADGEVVK